MRVGLMADTHDRVPVIAEFVRRDAGGRRRDAHPRGRLLRAVLPPADRGGEHVARGRVREERRRHARPARARRRRASAPSCSRGRTASSSADQRILRGARHRRRAAAQHRGPQHRRARLHAPAGDEDRGDTLIVNPGEACGWLYGTPKAAILDLDTKKVEFLIARSLALDDMTAAQPDPHHRLRVAVHPADRAPRPRGARVLRDPSADAHARVDPRLEADRHHPQRRAELGVRRERPDRGSARCSTSRRCWASATACSSSRTCSAARSSRGGRREYGRAEIRPTVPSALFEGFDAERDGDRVDEPRRSHRVARRRASASPPRARAIPSPRFEHESKPIYGVQFHPEVAHTPRGGRCSRTSCSTSAARRRAGRRARSSRTRSRRSARSSATRR